MTSGTGGAYPITAELTHFSRCWSTPATRSATGTPTTEGRSGSRGTSSIDRESGRYLARDAPELAARGLRVVGVAGAGRHHADAIESDAAAPGQPLELRRDPANEHDPNAIAVHAGDGQQVGWVPRELAAELAPVARRGRRVVGGRAARAAALAARPAPRADDAAGARRRAGAESACP